MGVKEFLLKTGAFIVLPGLLLYTCQRMQQDTATGQSQCRSCMESLQQPGVTGLTLRGYRDSSFTYPSIVRRHITDPAALQSLRTLAKGIRPVRVVPGTFRAAPRWYELIVAHGRDTCAMDLYKTRTSLEYLDCPTGSDSAFEVHRLSAFADSLFRIAPRISQRSTSLSVQQ